MCDLDAIIYCIIVIVIIVINIVIVISMALFNLFSMTDQLNQDITPPLCPYTHALHAHTYILIFIFLFHLKFVFLLEHTNLIKVFQMVFIYNSKPIYLT